MPEIKLGEIESRFADIIWTNEPLSSGELAKMAEKELGWKAKYDINRMCEDAYRWQSMNPNGYGE